VDNTSDATKNSAVAVFTNKDYDGGTASNTNRLTVPKNSTSNLNGLTRKQGTLLYDTSLLKLFIDNGTSLDAVGSGSGSGTGSLNIVTNHSAADNTTGWTAATNYTVSRDTSNSPLQGVVSTCFAISTTTASTESSTSGVYAASLAMPAALRNGKVQANLWVTVPATSAGVWRLSVYNASGTRMSLDRDSSSVFTLPGGYTGQLPFTFDTDTGATYTISITQTARTSANTLYATLISIGNGNVSQTAPVGNWQSYTPTFSAGFGSVSTINFWWRQVGQDMEIQGSFLTGTVAGSQANFTLPNSLTIGSTAVAARSSFGEWYQQATPSAVGVYTTAGVVIATALGANTLGFDYQSAASTTVFTPRNGSTAFNSSVIVTLKCKVPIAEWAGSVNTAPVPAEEFAYNSASWDATDSTSFAYGPAGGTISGSLTAGRTKRVRFQYPIQADDELTIEVKLANGPWTPINQTLGNYLTTATVEFGARLTGVSGSSTDVDVIFNQFIAIGSSLTATTGAVNWSTSYCTAWRVRKTKKAALPFANAGTDGSAGLYKAGQAPGQTTGATIGAGYVGERLTASLSNVTLSVSGTLYNAGSLVLTAGTWMVYGKVAIGVAGTTQTACEVSIGTTNGVQDIGTLTRDLTSGISSTRYLAPTPQYVNTTGTTVYLQATCSFTGTAPTTIGANSLFYAVRIA
jgi:hypothetical protein